MTIVALTGGIGAGKSTVTDRLSHHGVLVIDADVVAREVVAPGTPALQAISEHFGPGVLHPDGSLNREALGKIVFSDPDQRAQLEAIVHPAVVAESGERFARAGAEDPTRPIVYAVPLLVESREIHSFDLVVVVDTPREQRIARLVEYRGMSHDEATARVDAQASDQERQAVADVILDSSGSLETTLQAADGLAATLWECWPDRLDTIPRRFPPSQA